MTNKQDTHYTLQRLKNELSDLDKAIIQIGASNGTAQRVLTKVRKDVWYELEQTKAFAGKMGWESLQK